MSNGSGSGSGSGDDSDSMEEDDDEDHVRSKHPSVTSGGGGHSQNNANRAHSSGVDGRNRQQKPNNKQPTYDRPGANPNNKNRNDDGDDDDDDQDEDDDIQFTSGGAATPRTEVKPAATPTASSAPPVSDTTQQVISPNKAVTSYLVPIVVMWIGNMF